MDVLHTLEIMQDPTKETSVKAQVGRLLRNLRAFGTPAQRAEADQLLQRLSETDTQAEGEAACFAREEQPPPRT
jgi:hypothetical protein